jgi:hypothetical protein
MANASAALGANVAASGKITIDAVSGTGNITDVLVSGISQISGPINVSGETAQTLAVLIANDINSTSPASGLEYTATALNNEVYVFAPPASGSDANGNALIVSNDDPGNIQTTEIAFAGGSSSNSVYDENHGYRFYLNPDVNAVDGDLTGATEITNEIIPANGNSTIKQQDYAIQNGSVNPERIGSITSLLVDTEASVAADDLDIINSNKFADGDIVILRGTASSRVVSISGTGNIVTSGAFQTGGREDSIILQYYASTEDVVSPTWYEIARSSGVSLSLATALANGQNTGGKDIIVDDGDDITFLDPIGGKNKLVTAALTANRIITLPDATGTVALTSDISGFIDGAGTANRISKFSDADTIADSQFIDNGVETGSGSTESGQQFTATTEGTNTKAIEGRSTKTIGTGVGVHGSSIGASSGKNIGIIAEAQNGFSNIPMQYVDGNDNTGKVLYISNTDGDVLTAETKAVAEVTVILTRDSILGLNSFPEEIIPAPGPGKAIDIISATFTYKYNSTPFVGNNLKLRSGLATNYQWSYDITAGADEISKGVMESTGGDQLRDNGAILAFVPTSNPTGGGTSSSIAVTVLYRKIDV